MLQQTDVLNYKTRLILIKYRNKYIYKEIFIKTKYIFIKNKNKSAASEERLRKFYVVPWGFT